MYIVCILFGIHYPGYILHILLSHGSVSLQYFNRVAVYGTAVTARRTTVCRRGIADT